MLQGDVGLFTGPALTLFSQSGQITTVPDGGKGEPTEYEFPPLKPFLSLGVAELCVVNPGKRKGPPPAMLALRALALLREKGYATGDAAAHVADQWKTVVGKAPSAALVSLVEEVRKLLSGDTSQS